MLTVKMASALADALVCDLDPWDYGSSVISTLKKRGFIELNEPTIGGMGNGMSPRRYHATDAGRDAWREWCRASMVDTTNAAKA